MRPSRTGLWLHTTPTLATAQALGQWEGLGARYPGYSITAVPPDPNIAVGPRCSTARPLQRWSASSSLSAGAHSITAQYGGDAFYNGSTSSVLAQTVGRKK